MSDGMRMRLDLAYDGTDFSGWATQPGRRSVQGELEAALAALFSKQQSPPPRLVVAGRTDAGVHARGQVAHLDLDAEAAAQLARLARGAEPGAALAARLNAIAGAAGDVRVLRAAPAPAGFDARFSAVWRRYEYRIADAAARQDPLRRRDTVWADRELDVGAMNAVAASLLGLHDWAAYCRRPPHAAATTIRELQAFEWSRDEDGVVIGQVRADAFCHSMVRSLVGACAAVGEGRLDAAAPVELRAAGERTSAFKVWPAHGLALLEVGYPPDAELAERAAATRAVRTSTERTSTEGA